MNDRLTELPVPSALFARASTLAWQYCSKHARNATAGSKLSTLQMLCCVPVGRVLSSNTGSCQAASGFAKTTAKCSGTSSFSACMPVSAAAVSTAHHGISLGVGLQAQLLCCPVVPLAELCLVEGARAGWAALAAQVDARASAGLLHLPGQVAACMVVAIPGGK